MEIRLEPITKADLEFARKLRNKNRKYFFDSSYISKETHAKWFKNLDYFFGIIWIGKERIGTIGQKDEEIHNVIIDEKYRSKGILKEVLTMFEPPVFVTVLSTNKQGIAIYKKLGFKLMKLVMYKK